MSLPPLRQVITADTRDLTRALNSSQARIARFARIGAAAFAAVGAALVAMTRRAMQNADELAKQARSVGLTTDALQAMSLVAREAGVSTQNLTQSMGLMQRQIVELERGSATATRAFDALGLSIQDLQGRNPDEQFRKIAEALNAIEDPAQRTTAAMEIFGRSGRQVINMLDDYGRKVDEASEFQRRFGIAIEQTDAEAIERANDAVGRLREAFGGLGNLLAVRFAPAIERVANATLRLAGRFADRLNPATDDFVQEVLRANQHMPSMQAGLDGIGRAAGGAAGQMSEAAKAAKALVDEIVRAREEGGADLSQYFGRTTRETGVSGPIRPTGPFITSPTGQDGRPGEGIQDFLDGPRIFLPAPSPLAPATSPRPRERGVDDFPDISPGIGGAGAVTDQMAERLEALRNALATEAEVVQEWFAEGMQTLNDALSERRITEEEYHEMRERLEREHQERLNEIRADGDNRGLQSAKGFFQGIASIAQAGGRRMQKITAASAAVIGLIDAYGAALKALNSPEPLTVGQRFAAYASVLGAGMKAVAAIQNIGSGGGGAASGLGSAAGASAAPALPRQNITIDLVGDTFSRNSVQSLFEEINRGLRSGYQIEGVLVR